jgi:hypothetical protein
MSARFYVAAIGLLVLLLVVTALTLPLSGSDIPALSVRSTNPDGSMALDEWLAASGYPVQEVTSLTNQLDHINLLFILNPVYETSEQDAAQLRDWVQQGNTLIVAGSPVFTETLLHVFNVQMDYLLLGDLSLSAAAPTLLNPPFDSARVEATYSITTERDDAVPHLFSEGQPILVSFPEGAGTVWLSGALRPFTNLGLNDPGNARLITNLVAAIPHNAIVGFDEIIHGFGEDNQQTLSVWLFGTAPGWAILIAFTLTMVYLALRGRRFGRALPLPEQQVRRDTREYIQAIATLFRRSGQRGEIVRHYDQQLRRRLSERYAVDPNLAAAEMVKAVAERDPTLDAPSLGAVLHNLARQNLSEQQLVAIASEVDRWLRSIH